MQNRLQINVSQACSNICERVKCAFILLVFNRTNLTLAPDTCKWIADMVKDGKHE